MRGHWLWDFAFLNSNYHLEHHYFPGVPFYRLPACARTDPFTSVTRCGADLRPAGLRLLIENRAPHTDWSRNGEPAKPQPVIDFSKRGHSTFA